MTRLLPQFLESSKEPNSTKHWSSRDGKGAAMDGEELGALGAVSAPLLLTNCKWTRALKRVTKAGSGELTSVCVLILEAEAQCFKAVY